MNICLRVPTRLLALRWDRVTWWETRALAETLTVCTIGRETSIRGYEAKSINGDSDSSRKHTEIGMPQNVSSTN